MRESGDFMRKIGLGIIGMGMCGAIRAEACAASPYVCQLHYAETNEERLNEVVGKTTPDSAGTDYRKLLANNDIDAIIISTTPETTHFPFAKEALSTGKHVFLEKPIAITLAEVDELIALAKAKDLVFTIGYSQRFNTKLAYAKRAIDEGSIGEPITALVSRHITRSFGYKISGRGKLSPAAMEATHDIDIMLWCLSPRKPVRVYAQEVRKLLQKTIDAADCVWIVVTMDDGTVFTIGAGWVLPPGYPNYSSAWIEIVGTEGSITIDDTHRDVVLNTMQKGIVLPISTMPGEKVSHVYAGPMEAETLHFLECVALNRQPLVTPEQARMAMQVYQAADLSALENRPIDIAW